MRVGFIGGGTMAEAILSRAIEAGLARPGEVAVGEPLESRRTHLAQKYSVATAEHNLQAVAGAEVVVLAVKPQDLGAVLKELRGSLKPTQAVASLVAGAKMASISQGLNHQAVLRVMPNTPAQVGAGVSAWTAAAAATDDQKKAVRALLRTIGEEVYVTEEKYLDMATALSGSGPAYVFLFIEALVEAGVHIGLPRELSKTLVLQTVRGSAQMVASTGRHPAELREMVTSPGGTTAAGLMALEDGKFRAAVLQAVASAHAKSQALGRSA